METKTGAASTVLTSTGVTSTGAHSAVAHGGAAREPVGEGRRLRGNPTLTLLAVALGVMMVALDGTIVAVANPAIQEHLNASLAGHCFRLHHVISFRASPRGAPVVS